MIEKLGINKIIRYNGNTKVNINSSPYILIAKIISEYMYSIDMNIEEIRDPLFIRKRELFKLEISEIILSSFNSESLYSSFSNKKKLGSGFSAIVFSFDNDMILKYQDLRFGKLSKKYIENHNKYFSKGISYLFNNYEVFITSIQLLIQNYLYKLNNNYVPEILSYSISYEDGLSLTIIKLAFLKNNKNIFIGNMHEFIIKQSKIEDSNIFIKNLLLILKEVCVILDFYQKECYFIHGDLHINNIMLECEINSDNSIKKLKIKLIDFQFSSIIFSIDGKLKLFKDFNFGFLRIYEEINPFISSNWNKIDILYLLSTTLYYLDTNSKNNFNIKNFLLVLLKIFNINSNSTNLFINNTNNSFDKFVLFLSIFKKKNKFNTIFIKNNQGLYNEKLYREKIYKKFIPSNLLKELDDYIKNI